MSIQCQNRFHTNEAGQSLVEFALILGLMVILLLGMIDLANLLQQKADLDTVVRQAARQAGEFGGGQDQVETFIKEQLILMEYPADQLDDTDYLLIEVVAQEVNSGGEIVDKAGEPSECSYGEFISVKVRMNWETSIPYVLFFDAFERVGVFNMWGIASCWRA